MKIELEIDDTVAALLGAIDEEGDVKMVISYLVDHAQQGVYRPGAWEREWLIQVFGDEWISKLVPGDPYGRGGNGEQIFVKPPGFSPRSEDGSEEG